MFVSDTRHNAQNIHNLLFFFFFFFSLTSMIMDLSSLNDTSTWFDHSFRYFHSIFYCCPQSSPDMHYLKGGTAATTASSSSNTHHNATYISVAAQNSACAAEWGRLSSAFVGPRPRVTVVRPLLGGRNLCQDVWLRSLSTSTTSNPCHADWPVNCCNAQSRVRRQVGPRRLNIKPSLSRKDGQTSFKSKPRPFSTEFKTNYNFLSIAYFKQSWWRASKRTEETLAKTLVFISTVKKMGDGWEWSWDTNRIALWMVRCNYWQLYFPGS